MYREGSRNIEPELSAKDRLMTRRTFGRVAFGSALAATISSSEGPKERRNTFEWNPEYSDRLILIDFAPDEFDPDFDQWSYFSDNELLRRELGENYYNGLAIGGFYTASQKARTALAAMEKYPTTFGAVAHSARVIFDELGLQKSLEEQMIRHSPQFGIASAALADVGEHGKGVAHVMWQNIAGIRGDRTGITPRIYPIQRTMDIRFNTDELGNYTLIAQAKADEISHALNYYPEQDIVNFSWQVGEVAFHVTTNTRDAEGNVVPLAPKDYRFEKKGAYGKETAVKNLRELFSICNDHPDKLFFTALGNFSDDIRDSRRILADEWPENIMIIGEWLRESPDDPGRPNFDSFGADLYIDNQEVNPQFSHGSSFSTAIASSTAVMFDAKGYTHQEIKELFLTSLSRPASYLTSHQKDRVTSRMVEHTRLYTPREVPRHLHRRIQ